MKKLLSIAFAASSTAALATTTITGQAIGSIKIESTLTNTIVAVAFNELSPIAGQQISVSNIVNAAELAVGDKVYVLNNGQYEGWTLAEASGGYKYWAKNVKAFSLDAGGQETEKDGASADSVQPEIGTGIWVQRANPSGSFHVYGAVPSSTATTVTAGTKTLFGNPTNTAKAPTISGMVKGDRILIPTDGAPNTIKYNKNNKWVYSQGSTVVTTDAPPAIPAGTGAWYVSTGSSNVTITW